MLSLQPSRFLAWWFGELRSLVPGGWRRSLGRERRPLEVEVFDGVARFRRRAGGARDDLGRIDLGARCQAARQTVQHLLRASGARADDLVLSWAPDLVLRKTVELPLAAAENLREVLYFEMDRHTPFKADEVYFDHARVDMDRVARKLKAELFVVPKSLADPVLRTVRSWGLAPARMSVATADGHLEDIDLLPAETEVVEPRSGWRLSTVLAAVAGVLAVAAVSLPLYRQQSELTALEDRIARARAAVAEVEDLRRRIGTLQDRSRALIDRKRSLPPAVQVLAEITRLLPDDTWITELSLRGGEIRLSGHSRSTSSLIRLLEQSDLFSDVRFTAPVTQDTRFDSERFNISASVSGTGEPA